MYLNIYLLIYICIYIYIYLLEIYQDRILLILRQYRDQNKVAITFERLFCDFSTIKVPITQRKTMIWSINCKSFILGSAFVFLLFQNKIYLVYICIIWKSWHYRDWLCFLSHSFWRAYIFIISADLQFPLDTLFGEISNFKISKLQVYVFKKHLNIITYYIIRDVKKNIIKASDKIISKSNKGARAGARNKIQDTSDISQYIG